MQVPVAGRWLLAACAAGLAGCAAAPVPSVAASDYRPVLRSTLVSRAEPAFVQAQRRQGGTWTTVLARRDPLGAPVPVAVTRAGGAGDAPLVSVQWLPEASQPMLDLLALEHLYALVLRQDAAARYCLAVGARACGERQPVLSHAALLRELAARRRVAARQAGDAVATVPWRDIRIGTPASLPGDPDDVAVRVEGDDGPLAGAAVYFNRAPHSGCAARTDAAGVAGCHLVDQHGDDGAHAGEDAHAPVVVTYPGDVRADRVLLPTTFVLPPRPS